MATQLNKNDISAILNALCTPCLQLQYPCQEFKTTLFRDVEWKPEYLSCWNGQRIEAFIPAHMPFLLGNERVRRAARSRNRHSLEI